MSSLITKDVRLAELKLVDMVVTGDTLVFCYKKRSFEATVTREAYLQCPNVSKHPFHSVSRWTNACVKAMCSAENRPKTNASGYDGVVLVRTGETLAQLRNAYVQVFAHQVVRQPHDVRVQPTIKKRTTSARPSLRRSHRDVLRELTDLETSVRKFKLEIAQSKVTDTFTV